MGPSEPRSLGHLRVKGRAGLPPGPGTLLRLIPFQPLAHCTRHQAATMRWAYAHRNLSTVSRIRTGVCQRPGRIAENIAYLGDLGGFLVRVALIDADCVNPDHEVVPLPQ